jgi:PAS domain S-box-containing protein
LNERLLENLKELSKYQFISDAAKDFMTLINKKYEYVAVNDSYCREHQKKKEDILGKKVAEVWGKDSFNKYIKEILKKCFKGEIVQYQDWFHFENNRTGYYDVIYYPYYDEKDTVTHVAVVTRDITKLKNTETDLKKSEDKYRSLINSSFDLIFRLNVHFIFTYVSHASERLFDIPPENFIGRDFSEVFLSDEEKSAAKLKEKLSTGENIEAVKLRIRTGKNDFNFIEVNALPLFDNDEIMGYQGTVRDLTQRMKLETKQKELEAELIKEHRLASIGMLTSGLAHNIRSPLTAILGAIHLMKMDGAKGLDTLEIIYASAKKIEMITESLMDKLRKEQEEEKQELSINDILKNELQILEGNLEFKHNVAKEINLSEYIPSIYGVYNSFSQAFANIIQNALDAMYKRTEKRLKIRTLLDDGHIKVYISDTGCGISEENINKLFDPFYTSKPKVVKDDSDEPRGTGLGLYSCYNMLKPYKAKFHVSSQIYVGTTFEISIPVEINQKK